MRLAPAIFKILPLLGLALTATFVQAQEQPQTPEHTPKLPSLVAQYEREVWQRMYEGEFDGNEKCFYLRRFDNQLQGATWPKEGECTFAQVPSHPFENQAVLMGSWGNDGAIFVMKTNRHGDGLPETKWHLSETVSDEYLDKGQGISTLTGTSKTQALAFRQQRNVPDMPALPYRTSVTIREYASANLHTYGKTTTSDECRIVYMVSAINIYDGAQLLQTLPATSYRHSYNATCMLMAGVYHFRDVGPYLPEVVDLNADGHADLRLATTPTQGEKAVYQHWLYDPKTGQFQSADDTSFRN